MDLKVIGAMSVKLSRRHFIYLGLTFSHSLDPWQTYDLMHLNAST